MNGEQSKTMKYSTNEQFKQLDFHDSYISSLVVNPDNIEIGLEFANILAEHDKNPYQVAKNIEPCKLVFTNVETSEAKSYNDKSGVFVPHPNPSSPLGKEILEAKELVLDSTISEFTLCGFDDYGWTEWKIKCKGFVLSWEKFDGDSWFVNWPPETA